MTGAKWNIISRYNIWVKVFKDGQVKFAEGGLTLSKLYHFKFFKGCLPQILLGPFLNTLIHIISIIICFSVFLFFYFCVLPEYRMKFALSSQWRHQNKLRNVAFGACFQRVSHSTRCSRVGNFNQSPYNTSKISLHSGCNSKALHGPLEITNSS